MLVTANGRYPKAGIDAFVDLADRRGLALIEDAAQSLGSHFPDGRHMGSAGKVGSFSFSVPKIITTGQGGCLITNDNEIAERLRNISQFNRRHALIILSSCRQRSRERSGCGRPPPVGSPARR